MALDMKRQIRPAIVLTLLLTVVTGLLYPGIVTGLAQLLFPSQANGSLHTVNGQVIGSDLIGQYWTAPKYFHGRPSATVSVTDSSKSEPYNAQNSAASNLGPTNKNLQDAVQARVKELQKENPGVPVPVDLVTASGSGLDPDISVAGALFQVPRIAKERGMSEDQVRALVMKHVQGRFLGILGEEHVNVLELNLALDGK
ncbi:potassium-transporting ATPase, C subunit [Ktedonobacter racemifer DSM 44963]|uniref:Potassium-transporting ATPase KdpC subunit n=2 Tax=Ktedonobacter racemifer TaxID=363277 RepID=D6U6J1_KTERA|nr:potassium-transporting ATPase subunit KdpC [Ktedonobacter racemifer]EFH80602.1 potassium-transporting ATPase, C subunit [Ktedonobacter racemifer DSM 44963]